MSQLALYQGADREKILIDGAKKEAAFTLYDSHTWFRTPPPFLPCRSLLGTTYFFTPIRSH